LNPLSAAQRRQVKSLFTEHLRAPVRILFFFATARDPSTHALCDLLGDLAQLSDGKITVESRTGPEGRAEAAAYGVEQVPALALLDGAGRDTRIRFYGVPMGVDFAVLLEDLIDVSRGETRLTGPARALIRAIDRDLVIQVYSSPT